MTPAHSPQQAVKEFAGFLQEALQLPAIRTKLVALGLYPVGSCGADFAAFLQAENEAYGRIIRENNLRAE